MKNWIKYIICASLFTTVSCGDNFLEIKPLSIFTPESIYTDKAGFDGILIIRKSKCSRVSKRKVHFTKRSV